MAHSFCCRAVSPLCAVDTDHVLPRITALVAPLLAKQSAELVECTLRREGRRFILRFLVETPQGITLDQCAALNRQIGAALDEANLVEESYVLEVASPGLDRPLVTERDYERVLGDKISITTQVEGRTATQTGRLMHVDAQVLVLEIRAGERVSIPRVHIRMGRRVITI